VIVLYEKGWLIGEMTVSSYVYIDKPPRTEVEKNLYRLVTYPVTIDEDPVVFDTWLKGHIIYSDFKVYGPPVNFDILGRNMSHGGSLNLGFDELQRIRGRKKVSQSGKQKKRGVVPFVLNAYLTPENWYRNLLRLDRST